MAKLLQRIVTLFLVLCSVADYGSAVTCFSQKTSWTNLDTPPITNRNLFEEQALSGAVELMVHALQSTSYGVRRLLAPSKNAYAANGIFEPENKPVGIWETEGLGRQLHAPMLSVAIKNGGTTGSEENYQAKIQRALDTTPDTSLNRSIHIKGRRWRLLGVLGFNNLLTRWRLFRYASLDPKLYVDGVRYHGFLIGKGSHSEVYGIPGFGYVARIPRGMRNELDPSHPLAIFSDRLGDLNVGQVIARVGSIEIMERQLGEQAGIPYYNDLGEPLRSEDLDTILVAHLHRTAEMPLSAYVDLATTLKRVALADYAFDDDNPNNLLVDKDNHRFGLVDVHDARPGFFKRLSNIIHVRRHRTPSSNFGGMLNVLMNLSYAKKSFPRLPQAQELLRTIFENALIANQIVGGLSDRGADLKLSEAVLLVGLDEEWAEIRSKLRYDSPDNINISGRGPSAGSQILGKLNRALGARMKHSESDGRTPLGIAQAA